MPTPTTPGPEPAPTPEDLRQAVHRLRNHVNSLVMNASALAFHCKDRQVGDDYLARIEAEAQRCKTTLDTLGNTLD